MDPISGDRAYYGLFIDYIQKTGLEHAIHTRSRGLRRAL